MIVGSFDPARGAFSAYFEGVDGCTSFEARKDDTGGFSHEKKKKIPVKHVVKKKKIKKVQPKNVEKSKSVPAASAQSTVVPMDDKKAGGIDLTPKAAVSASSAPAVPTTIVPVSTTAPAVPSSAVPLTAKPAPGATSAPAPVLTPAATSNPVPLVAKPVPIVAPVPAPVSTATPAAPITAPKPASSSDAVPFVPSEFLVPATTASPATTGK